VTKAKVSRPEGGGRKQTLVLADVAQLVEHSLGKGEVTSSILVIGSRNRDGTSSLESLGITGSTE
jgi:hypothetical protein